MDPVEVTIPVIAGWGFMIAVAAFMGLLIVVKWIIGIVF